MSHQLSRRRSLRALAALPAAGAQPGAPAAPASVPVGVATLDFRDHTNQSLAAEFQSQGVRHTQLFFTQKDSNYWKYGVPVNMESMTPDRAKGIAAVYRAAGVSIGALGVYATLIHPDADDRKRNLAYFETMMKIGGHMGVRTFLTEMGHYAPPGPAPRIPFDFQTEVWRTATATAKELGRLAEAHGATVLLEPYYLGLLATAKRTRVFLEETGSPAIRAQLDPANLLEVNDLDEMFAQLKPWIGGIHAKDRKLHTPPGVPAGQGDLNYREFVTLAARHAPGIPLIIEYAGTKNYRQALGHLRAAIREAGLREA